jgi:hypothetical protein
MIGMNAVRNGDLFVKADTNTNQPIKGESHSGIANMVTNVTIQLSNRGAALQIRYQASAPRMETQTLAISKTTKCVIIISMKVTSGITTSAVISFDVTVSESVTGIDRQNKMLLSFRSAYKQSRE